MRLDLGAAHLVALAELIARSSRTREPAPFEALRPTAFVLGLPRWSQH